MAIPSLSGVWAFQPSAFNAEKYQSNFSDASLIILNSNNNPVVKLNFQDLFPVSIEGLDFDLTTAGMEYFIGIAAFRYRLFTIEQYWHNR